MRFIPIAHVIWAVFLAGNLFAMKSKMAIDQLGVRSENCSEIHIPLLARGAILDSIDGSTLTTLAIGLLEQNKFVQAKHLIQAAAAKREPTQKLYIYAVYPLPLLMKAIYHQCT